MFTKKKYVILYLIYEFLGYCSYFLAYSMLNLICRDFIRISDGFTGFIIGTMTLASGTAVFLVPIIASKFNRLKANFAVLITLCFLYFTMVFILGKIYLLFVIVTAMMQCMIAGFIEGPVLETIPDKEKGSFSGLRLLLITAGTSLGTLAAGWFIGSIEGISVHMTSYKSSFKNKNHLGKLFYPGGRYSSQSCSLLLFQFIRQLHDLT